MATNETLKINYHNKIKTSSCESIRFKRINEYSTMKRKFEEVLHENANAFMSNVMTLVSNDSYLAKASQCLS